jgi:hypothetical protein
MAGYTACSDDQAIAAALPIASYSSTTARIGWVNMGLYSRGQFIIQVGAVGAAESVTAVAQQATDTNGSGAKALNTAKAITAITASNKSAVIDVNGQDIDANNNFQYASVLLTFVNSGTTATAETFAGGLFLGQPETTPPPAFAGSQVVGNT